MLPALMHPLQLLGNEGRDIPINPVEDELGIAQDGMEWGAEFMAHLGEELRLVLVRLLQVPRARRDFVFQVGVGRLQLGPVRAKLSPAEKLRCNPAHFKTFSLHVHRLPDRRRDSDRRTAGQYQGAYRYAARRSSGLHTVGGPSQRYLGRSLWGVPHSAPAGVRWPGLPWCVPG